MFDVNSFQVPNKLVDEFLDELSGNELKILLTIIRKTKGWHKEYDGISISQFQNFTGISSHNTIRKAINKLIKLKLVEKIEQSGTYPLFKIIDPYQKLTMSKIDNDLLPKIDNDPYQKLTTQTNTNTKDTNTKKINKTTTSTKQVIDKYLELIEKHTNKSKEDIKIVKVENEIISLSRQMDLNRFLELVEKMLNSNNNFIKSKAFNINYIAKSFLEIETQLEEKKESLGWA